MKASSGGGRGVGVSGLRDLPPHRAPVSPFRLRKKSECVSRRLRLSSSTKVRGPLAPARPSKVSSSSHQPDHRAARGAIFLLQRNQAPGHRKCPFRGRPIKARCLGVSPEVIRDRRSRASAAAAWTAKREEPGRKCPYGRRVLGTPLVKAARGPAPPREERLNLREHSPCGRGQSVGPRALGSARCRLPPESSPARACLLFRLAPVWAAASRSGSGPEVS